MKNGHWTIKGFPSGSSPEFHVYSATEKCNLMKEFIVLKLVNK